MILLKNEKFSEIVFADFEYQCPEGHRPTPHCLVAHEMKSGKTHRVWADELQKMDRPPYPDGPDVLFVAWSYPAEGSCYLALNWEQPQRVLDPLVEFRVAHNNNFTKKYPNLLGALSHYGISAMTSETKTELRDLAIRGAPFSNEEKRALLEYCEVDVAVLPDLLIRMLPDIEDVRRAVLVRGEYQKAVAQMIHHGVPIDTESLQILRDNWTRIQSDLIAEVDQDFGIYEGRTFKLAKFEAYLEEHGISWPRTPKGRVATDQDTFREMSAAWPQLLPLKELRTSLGQLRLEKLAMGPDGRNRCFLFPFKAMTSRNLPSNAKFIFGPSTWIRGLIRPDPGHGIAYIDWRSQEFGVSAVLSQDPKMLQAYASGDVYMDMAIQFGMAPPGATRKSHGHMRDLFKQIILATNYSMGPKTLSVKINGTRAEARRLLQQHRMTYPVYWKWSDGVFEHAATERRLRSVFGFQVNLLGMFNERSARNWPVQTNAAEMMRLAAILALKRGVKLNCPIHDAFLLEAPVEELDEKIRECCQAMSDASAYVLDGFRLKTDVKKVIYPARYMDPRGVEMWGKVWRIIDPAK